MYGDESQQQKPSIPHNGRGIILELIGDTGAHYHATLFVEGYSSRLWMPHNEMRLLLTCLKIGAEQTQTPFAHNFPPVNVTSSTIS